MGSHVIGPFLTANQPLDADERATLDAATDWDADTLDGHGSFAIGPFLTANKPLTDNQRAMLDISTVWDFGTLAPQQPFDPATRIVVPARPRAHHGSQQGRVVASQRRPAPYVPLPRSQLYVPGPGSHATGPKDLVLQLGTYGQGAYGVGNYGGS